jgi:para-aminobenzoate synthetase component 1
MARYKAIPQIQPLSTSLKPVEVCEMLDNEQCCFFLDSGMHGDRLGRYSFLGYDPFLTFRNQGERNEITRGNSIELVKGNPFDILKTLFSKYRLITPPEMPPFLGGAVGYFSYDLKHFVEKLPSRSKEDITIPLCFLAFYDTVIIFDHYTDKAWISSTGLPEESEHLKQLRAKTRIKELFRKLDSGKNFPSSQQRNHTGKAPINLESNFTRDEYLRAVQQVKKYIAAGDIYQANLSQRFSAAVPTRSFELYKTLRTINPAPFAAYLKCGGTSIISSSPERFLRLSGKSVETRPIKGTRPRGGNRVEDEQLKRELLTSPKDRAELIMIVDLERNDLGRVCEYGTVKVPELITLETYPTVFHLVSTITGNLKEDKDHIDCIKATFPGGSITGAPKIRAMEIIDELEPTRRNVYTGSVGYIGFNQQTDLNIVIRSILHSNGNVHFQVGGGIVADSDPVLEYEETLHKGRALMEALYQNNNIAIHPSQALGSRLKY